ASIWQPPVDRKLAVVSELGPLAEKAREVLNNGVWAIFDETLVRNPGLPPHNARPMVGFYWDISVTTGPRSRMLHRLFVSQQDGRTEVILLVRSATDRGVPEKTFLTSPRGTLEKAWGVWDKQAAGGKFKSEEIPPEQAA